MDRRDKRAREIQTRFARFWFATGIRFTSKDIPEAQDEYDAYVGAVYHLIASGASEFAIASHLASVERESMGFSTSAEALLQVARRLRQLDVRLPPA